MSVTESLTPDKKYSEPLKGNINHPFYIPITYNGRNYCSIKSLARELGVSYNRLYRYKKLGYTTDEAVSICLSNKDVDFLIVNLDDWGAQRGKSVTFEGKEYSSLRELYKAYNTNYSSVSRRLKKGLTFEEAVKYGYGRLMYEGVKYLSLEDLATSWGMSYQTLRYRLNKGMGLEEALNSPLLSNSKKRVEYRGNNYPSLKSLAESFNLPYNLVKGRYRAGWSIESIVETPVK